MTIRENDFRLNDVSGKFDKITFDIIQFRQYDDSTN